MLLPLLFFEVLHREGRVLKLKNLIGEITEWIDENLLENMTIDDVAARSGYSKWHLQRVFFQVNNASMGNYIRNKRLEMAAKDLVETEDSIVTIVDRYGFESQQSFSRSFTKQFNLPPGRYRIVNAKNKYNKKCFF